jgi:hypothetical protein
MDDAAPEPGEEPGPGGRPGWAPPDGPPRPESFAQRPDAGAGGPATGGAGALYGGGDFAGGAYPGAGYAGYAPALRSSWPGQVEIRWAVAVMVLLALVGVGAGALWIGLVPRQEFVVVKAGEALRSGTEGEAFIAADGWYFFLTLVIGLLAGVLAWLPRSGRGALMPVALAAGGAAGSLATWAFGEWLTPRVGRGALQHVGATVLLPVQLKAEAAAVVEAFAAVAVYLILAGFAERADLGSPEPTDAGG